MSKNFKSIDLSGQPGRTFVVGDIHGQFELLEWRLKLVGFDPDKGDVLLSVGDLVDRGPFSNRAVEFAQKPWFHHVKGNHEVMTLDPHGGSSWHVSNGGAWFNELPDTETQKLFQKVLNDAPWIMKVTTQSGKKVGLAHAGLPSKQAPDGGFTPTHFDEYANWGDDDFRYWEDVLIWDRYQYGRARKASERPNEHRFKEFNVPGVDAVYFGHTPIKQPLTVGNCNWIDTGAFATNILTVVEA